MGKWSVNLMIEGRDSSAIPTTAQLADAYAAGVRVWGGYFDGPGISHGWTAADFAAIKAAGMTAVAYCSGWSDPYRMQQQRLAWNVDYLFVDVESGIRSDGPWVQGWLYDSGAGLYGNQGVFAGRTFPYCQLAAYPGNDPEATWGSPPVPTVPHGWQWQGTHTEFGISCDSAWWDDAFLSVHPGNSFDKEDGRMFAVRPDGSAVDYFFIDANKDLGVGVISGKGVQTQTTPSPYAGHAIAEIQAAGWTTGCLVAQVLGADGITYLARWVNGSWQELLSA